MGYLERKKIFDNVCYFFFYFILKKLEKSKKLENFKIFNSNDWKTFKWMEMNFW